MNCDCEGVRQKEKCNGIASVDDIRRICIISVNVARIEDDICFQ